MEPSQTKVVARQKGANQPRQSVGSSEGVYGWLAEVAVPRATALIWLDIPWDVCREGCWRTLARHLKCVTRARGEIIAASTSQLALKTAENRCSAGLKPSIEP